MLSNLLSGLGYANLTPQGATGGDDMNALTYPSIGSSSNQGSVMAPIDNSQTGGAGAFLGSLGNGGPTTFDNLGGYSGPPPDLAPQTSPQAPQMTNPGFWGPTQNQLAARQQLAQIMGQPLPQTPQYAGVNMNPWAAGLTALLGLAADREVPRNHSGTMAVQNLMQGLQQRAQQQFQNQNATYQDQLAARNQAIQGANATLQGANSDAENQFKMANEAYQNQNYIDRNAANQKSIADRNTALRVRSDFFGAKLQNPGQVDVAVKQMQAAADKGLLSPDEVPSDDDVAAVKQQMGLNQLQKYVTNMRRDASVYGTLPDNAVSAYQAQAKQLVDMYGIDPDSIPQPYTEKTLKATQDDIINKHWDDRQQFLQDSTRARLKQLDNNLAETIRYHNGEMAIQQQNAGTALANSNNAKMKQQEDNFIKYATLKNKQLEGTAKYFEGQANTMQKAMLDPKTDPMRVPYLKDQFDKLQAHAADLRSQMQGNVPGMPPVPPVDGLKPTAQIPQAASSNPTNGGIPYRDGSGNVIQGNIGTNGTTPTLPPPGPIPGQLPAPNNTGQGQVMVPGMGPINPMGGAQFVPSNVPANNLPVAPNSALQAIINGTGIGANAGATPTPKTSSSGAKPTQNLTPGSTIVTKSGHKVVIKG